VSDAADAFTDQVPGAIIVDSNSTLVEQVDTVILAVKPQSFGEVSREIGPLTKNNTLIVSILAGITLEQLCRGLNCQRVVRVMPNTPSLVGCGASAYALGPGATVQDGDWVGRLLGSVGISFQVPDHLLDAVTGLSGSGPAYVYTIIEALSDGGVQAGLPRATASALAAQTVFGAAQMVLSTGEHPAVLRERVTSPGGTTISAMQVLERRGLRSALMDAVETATRRSAELGRSS
jgi:pyrroline-5-carboxylate reductase